MFVHVSRCLIYKVHSPLLTCYRLYIRSFQKSRTFFIFFCISRFRHLRSFKLLSAANSLSLSHLHLFVKNFFLRFSKFFVPDSHPLCFPLENAPLYYHPHPHLSTLFCPFFLLFLCLLQLVLILHSPPPNSGSLLGLYVKERTPDGVRSGSLCQNAVIRRPRSGRSLRRYACKRLQKRRCYPRHGKQRSCAPADSFEGWPPHGSWASC